MVQVKQTSVKPHLTKLHQSLKDIISALVLLMHDAFDITIYVDFIYFLFLNKLLFTTYDL